MKAIVKLPILTLSLFIILIGIFILIYTMGILDQYVLDITLKLWPITLIISGAFLFCNSLYNKKHQKTDQLKQKSYELAAVDKKNDLQLKINFAYGDLWIGPNNNGYRLNIEQASSLPEPEIKQIKQENSTLISVSMEKPLFPSPVTFTNKWELFCSTEDLLNLVITTHEANINLDLSALKLETFLFKGNSGYHEIIFGDKHKKIKGNIYSSSSTLSLVFLADMYIKLKLLNHFCRINYPQGDFIKHENGLFTHHGNPEKSAEIIVDGPLTQLNLDFKEL